MKPVKKKLSTVISILCFILRTLTFRIFGVWLMYTSGYWDLNPIWLFVAWGLIKYKDSRRLKNNFKREAAKAMTLRDERKLVVSNVEPLPSWVYFTDSERCEWLNKIIGHLWPAMQPYLFDQVKTFEGTFNKAMSNYVKNPNFSFVSICMGCLTPRVSGVRVYEKDACRFDRLIIDINLFYFSDSVFNCLMKHIYLGVEHFQIKGCLRTIVSTPKASSCPGLEVFFLRQPSVDFSLTGILKVGDIPGISSIIRNTIDSVIAKKLVLPNKFVIQYDDRIDLEHLKFPDPEGLFRVNVIEAKALGESTRFSKGIFGKLGGFRLPNNPYPYVIIAFGPKTFTSPSAKRTTDPVWNYTAEFIVDSFFDNTVTISVDDKKRNTHLGEISLGLKIFEYKKQFHSWIQLEGVPTGMINLRVSYHKLENNPKLLASNTVPTILEVLIDDAKNLTTIKNKLFAEISVGDVTQSSRRVLIDYPVFREVFLFRIKDPKTGKIRIKLINEDDKNHKTALGNVEFEIKQLLEAKNMEVFNKQTKINGANKTSRLSVSMRLRTLKS